MIRLPATLVLAAVSAAVLGPPVASAQPGGGPPPQNVVVDAARTQTLVQRRSVTGQLVSTRRALVATQAEGYVVEFDLIEGDTVRKGDPIARLDTELATLEVDRARALLEAASGLVEQRRAEADNADRDRERMARLADRNSASESERDDAETSAVAARAMLAQAEADVAAARAELALAERRLRDKTILAPFDAAVIATDTELGEWLDQGDTVVELIALDAIEARIDVPERLLPYLVERDAPITLRIPALGAAADREADLIGLVPLGNSVSRNFTARLAPRPAPASGGSPSDAGQGASESAGDGTGEGSGDTGALRPGMSLTAMIPTADRAEFTTIHKDAILRDDAGTFVYAAMRTGGPDAPPSAMPVRVEVLFATADRLAVRAPQLRPGVDVLVEGNERVFPTQPLNIMNGRSPDASAASDPPAN